MRHHRFDPTTLLGLALLAALWLLYAGPLAGQEGTRGPRKVPSEFRLRAVPGPAQALVTSRDGMGAHPHSAAGETPAAEPSADASRLPSAWFGGAAGAVAGTYLGAVAALGMSGEGEVEGAFWATLALFSGAGTALGASLGNRGRGFGRAFLAAGATTIPVIHLIEGLSDGGYGPLICYAAIQGLVGAIAALSAG